MAIVTAQDLYLHLDTSDPYMKSRRVSHINEATMHWHDEKAVLPRSFTMEDVEKFIDGVHRGISSGLIPMWKALRPWNIVNMEDRLDQTKPWIGWEIETGWQDAEARAEVLARFIKENDYVAVDDEGPFYGAELTWSPANNGKYDGTHPLLWVVSIADEFADDVVQHYSDDSVGTHVNISTPSLRMNDGVAISEVANALNHALSSFDYDDYERLFGRGEMYGGFFGQREWIEGKLFNTTYEREEAERYMVVADRLAAAIEALAAYAIRNKLVGTQKLRINNLLACLSSGAAADVGASMRGEYVDGHDLGTYPSDEYDDDDWDDMDSCDCDDCVAARERASSW